MEAAPAINRFGIRSLVFSMLITAVFSCTGCVSMLRIDGPYKGRVIDAETGQPIEGAVAHGTWSKVYPNPAGSSSEYYDSYEVLTDKDGNFEIPGKGLLILSNIDDMTLTIFKAGYDQWHPNNWGGLRNWKSDGSLTWDEYGKGTFKLKRLTMEERRNRSITLPRGPHKTQKLLLRESNKENMGIGRPLSTLAPEE